MLLREKSRKRSRAQSLKLKGRRPKKIAESKVIPLNKTRLKIEGEAVVAPVEVGLVHCVARSSAHEGQACDLLQGGGRCGGRAVAGNRAQEDERGAGLPSGQEHHRHLKRKPWLCTQPQCFECLG